MCIRDSDEPAHVPPDNQGPGRSDEDAEQIESLPGRRSSICLLYTSDAADERSSVDLGGRRIIKKKKKQENCRDIV